jgi:hypothetical protein
MSTRIFSRPTPSHYPAQLNCVRKRLSAPRAGRYMAPRPAPAMLALRSAAATLPNVNTEGVKNSAGGGFGSCSPLRIYVRARHGPPPEEGVKEFESVMLIPPCGRSSPAVLRKYSKEKQLRRSFAPRRMTDG